MTDHSQKYFFDLNNFDAPDVEEVDPNAPPPPPSFSLEEMVSARDVSFDEGRNTGLEQARVSREQYIAAQIEKIHGQMTVLIDAETRRDQVFEAEVLTLCRQIFAKAFPALNAREGLREVMGVIDHVLRTNTSPGKIVITVPPTEKDPVEKHLQALLARMPDLDPARLVVEESEDLKTGSCRIRWQDGNALRDHAALAGAIVMNLDRVLLESAKPLASAHADAGAHGTINDNTSNPLAPDPGNGQDRL